jgi:uncharacterized protein (TIGR00251 family)
MVRVTEKDGAVWVSVRVQPRASRDEIAGVHGDALKLRLTAPPVEGAANAACIRFFAQLLGISQKQVTIASGQTARNKVVRIADISRALFERAIENKNTHP